MLNFIIGHRGSGKSQWLNQIQTFYKKNKIKSCFFDLDKEIENLEGQSLFSLFKKGEKNFRKKEKKTFNKLIKSLPKNKICFVSAGAGLKFNKKNSWNVIAFGRPSDKYGRIFFNRPQLKPSQNPLEEYKNLYKKRSSYYFKQADEHFIKREHFHKLENSDLVFLGLKKIKKTYFTLRLNPWDIPKDEQKLKAFLQKRLHWGIRFFELNDETADSKLIKTAKSFIPKEKILFSSQKSEKSFSAEDKKNWSWDLSLGPPPPEAGILSLHHRNGRPLKDILKHFSAYKNRHLKLAAEIFNLKELKAGYDWFCKDPKNRSFLPRSNDGRWLWFRQLFGPQMLLHFIKERPLYGTNKAHFEVLDQPFLSYALPFIKKRKALGGVLGYPIDFSATPAEQDSFFWKKRKISIAAMPFKPEDINKKNLKILADLGFVFFALTSPLKEKAAAAADSCDSKVKKLKTANTLILRKNKWKAFNTDWDGLQILNFFSNKNTAVWGGGGLRPVLKTIMPAAGFYSARTGKFLNKTTREKFSKNNKKVKKALKKSEDINPAPQVLIWAVGRRRMKQGCRFPPKHWKPNKVIDINYTEDSPGREYALQIKAKYINGWSFFKKQAKKQREFFSILERKK